MNERLRTTSILALLLANAGCAGSPTAPVFDPDPMLHAPGGRIVFNRMCADEEPYQVKAYAPHGVGRRPSTGGGGGARGVTVQREERRSSSTYGFSA